MRWPKLCKAIEYVVDRHGPIDGRTRLLKLVYLADQRWLQVHGATYTEASYYRWNHGPFSREFLQAIDAVIESKRGQSSVSFPEQAAASTDWRKRLPPCPFPAATGVRLTGTIELATTSEIDVAHEQYVFVPRGSPPPEPRK